MNTPIFAVVWPPLDGLLHDFATSMAAKGDSGKPCYKRRKWVPALTAPLSAIDNRRRNSGAALRALWCANMGSGNQLSEFDDVRRSCADHDLLLFVVVIVSTSTICSTVDLVKNRTINYVHY